MIGAILLIIFFICIMVLIIYLGGRETVKVPENKTSEPEKDNQDLTVIKQEVLLVKKECELANLQKKLTGLEKDYDNFRALKESDSIIISITDIEPMFVYATTKFVLRLYKNKNSKSISIHDSAEQIFTSEEYWELLRLGHHKLNKETSLYNIIMARVDNYYQTQIETTKNKITIN